MDTRLKSQIDRRATALEGLSPDLLQEEVVATASNLSGLTGERRRLQRGELASAPWLGLILDTGGEFPWHPRSSRSRGCPS